MITCNYCIPEKKQGSCLLYGLKNCLILFAERSCNKICSNQIKGEFFYVQVFKTIPLSVPKILV